MEQNRNKDMNRRNFLKRFGFGGALSVAALYGCKGTEQVKYSPEGTES